MKQEIVKPIIRVGNSAGVLLPREWLNGKARIELISKPLDIKAEILEILEPYFEEIQGVYLAGSYARKEEDEKSDVDIVVITKTLNKFEKKGIYEISFISKENLKGKRLIINYPMILEAKVILNSYLLDMLKKELEISKDILNDYIKNTKEIVKLNEKQIKLSELEGHEKVLDSVGYSLVLRLKTWYILDCIKNNKFWKKQEFLKLIEKKSGSKGAYESYLNGKKEQKKRTLLVSEAKLLLDYLKEETKKWEKESKEHLNKLKA